MGIWLGLDVGAVRTGIAESDLGHTMAFPVHTEKTETLLAYLQKTYPLEGLSGVAIGLPVNFQGDATEVSAHALAIGQKIEALWPHIALHWVDERFTSKLAAQAAHAAGAKARVKKDKGMLDAASACLILDNFLTQKKRT
jgi:putative holliday junction resolvase